MARPQDDLTPPVLLRRLTAVNGAVLALFRWLCIVATALMVAVIGVQVLLRYGFNVGLAWAEEFSRMMMVAVAFLTAPILYLRGETIAMTAFADLLPPRVRALLALTVHCAVFFFTLWFAKLSLDFTVAGANIRAYAVGITMNYIYAVMPLSFTVFASVAAQMIWAETRLLLLPRRAAPSA